MTPHWLRTMSEKEETVSADIEDSPRISIIIPAHNEANVISRCLQTVTRGARPEELRIVVVCNACDDGTADVVRAVCPDATVIETPLAGKARALNLGDATTDVFPRVYLDADIEMGIDSLRLLAGALVRDTQCAAPVPEFVLEGRSWPIRAFYDVWTKMPYLQDAMVGSGVYGLSREGRAAFGEFPPLVADDQFVMQHFDRAHRDAVRSATFRVHPPRTLRGLVQIRTRVYRGNRELATGAATPQEPTGGRLGGLLKLSRRPRLWPALGVYVLVNGLATVRAARSEGDTGWERDDSARCPEPATDRRSVVGYLVSRYPAISHTFVMREVAGVRKAGLRVQTFSVQRAHHHDLLTEEDKREDKQTWAIQPVGVRTVLLAHVQLALRHPAAWATALAFAIRSRPPGLRSRVWGMFYFSEAVLLRRQCAKVGVRHIHAHLANVASDVAWLTAALGEELDGPGTWSWSFTMHGPAEFSNVERFSLREKVESAAAVLCISDYARSQIMALAPQSAWSKLSVVHMGVDLERYVPVRRVTRTPGAPVEILCVGRLDPVKGHLVLLQAVALLREGGRACRLTIVGSGPGDVQVQEMVERLGVQDIVTLAGPRGQDELPGFYQRADIFTLPSFAEGVPVVLMEAMACDLPVVSTIIMGIPELIETEVTGLLVPPGRADLLALALGRLIDDPALRARLGSAGRSVIEAGFDSRRCGQQVAELLQGMIALAAGSSR
jgi:colanic acid/amylovoran biosynthesis glycosyltransferase